MSMTMIIKPYIPILRWRPAEIAALEKLFSDERGHITPLIEFVMPAPSIDKESRKIIRTPKEKFFQELPDIPRKLLKSCGQTPVFIDVHLLGSDIRSSSLEQILSSSNELDLFSVPVIYIIPVTSTNADTETRTVAINYAKSSGHGLCIRIDKSYLSEESLPLQISNFIEINELDIKNTDLLIDLRVIDQSANAEDIANQLTQLPDLKKWRSFIVSGSVFPKDLTDFAAGEVHPLNRLEWMLWNNIRKTQLPRIPLFSDYTIQHPFYERVDAIGSASIRYTADDKWWIFRGKIPGLINRKTNIKGPGREQYIGHAQTLVKRDFYKKKDFSFGDAEIARIAAPSNKKPGSPTTWLTISINHHITLVARQTSNLVVSAEARSSHTS